MIRSVLVLFLAALVFVSVRTASGSQVLRVGILREQSGVVLLSDQPVELQSGVARTVVEPAAYQVRPGFTGIEVVGVREFDEPVRFIPSNGARVFVGVRPYRGLIEIRRTQSGRLTVVNELGLEEYLYGVLKMEVNPSWPSEALKAQAVAARTLALHSLDRFRAEGYDVRATTDSQVYGGINAEDPRTTAAVDVTRGEVAFFAGRPIFAAYHSDSGGFTENSENVWGGRYAYLKAVPDPLTSATPWVVRVDTGSFEDRLRRAGHVVSGITALDVTGVTPSGRAGAVRITSSSSVLTLRATELRSILGADAFKSTMFTVRLLAGEPAIVEFAGRGSGHGVGLSQWGARGQALVGKSYTEILRYYYSGITIESR